MSTNSAAGASHLVTRTLHLPITSDADAFGTTAHATERVVVALAEPTSEHRGDLEGFVIFAVEAELDRRGAAPPGWHTDEPLSTKLSDQLYRSRLLGAGGLALRFSRLDAIADAAGHLNAEDSDTLRQLFVLAEREPLQLYLPEPLASLRVVGAPQQLSDWLTAGSKAGRIAAIEYEPANAGQADLGTDSAPEHASLLPPRVEAFSTSASDELRLPEPTITALVPTPPVAPIAGAPPGEEQPECAGELQNGAQALDEQQRQRCSAWAAQLQSMSGPKVHGSVERAFLTAYLPLSREAGTGRMPEDMQATLDKWAERFAHSYATAFKNLNARPKRPRMVKDIVDIGVSWFRQHRARQCQLLMVSGMRFDLGQRLNEEIERSLMGRAVCADQTMLWAALPSNAESQQFGDAPTRAARGAGKARAETRAETRAESESRIENVRIGTREFFRLAQLANDLAKPGEVEASRLQRLASTLAASVVPWMREQPPETLIVIFGDHGFHWQATEHGTSAARCGGALPEQVLVPASAWLLGEARSGARAAPGVH